MPRPRDDLGEEFVSFALARPAKFGPENFAGDPIIEQFYDVVLRSFSLDVSIYVAWECPPDVAIVGLPLGSALIRSERLDGLLVEFYRLRGIQPLFAGELAQEVARSQVLRWLGEFLIGYRHPGLALDALLLRPELPGLDLGIWNPFRDETLASVPRQVRVALQCFSLGHELGHLTQARAGRTTLYEAIDGLAVMSHLDYDARARGAGQAEREQMRRFCEMTIDAGQLVTEIRADLFSLDAVAEFLIRAEGCPPETAVALALSSCEALIFTYHAKELARLLGQVAAGDLSEDAYRTLQLADGLKWAARARAIGRHAGFSLTLFEEGPKGDFHSRVDRIDALMLATSTTRTQLMQALGDAQEALLHLASDYADGLRHDGDLPARLGGDPSLHLELFHILIAFGCPGGVDVGKYLSSMSQAVHRVADSASSR